MNMAIQTGNKEEAVVKVTAERPANHNYANMLNHYIGNDLTGPFKHYSHLVHKINMAYYDGRRKELSNETKRRALLSMLVRSYERRSLPFVDEDNFVREHSHVAEGVRPECYRILPVEEQRERVREFNNIYEGLKREAGSKPRVLTLEKAIVGSLKMCNLAESEGWDLIANIARNLGIPVSEQGGTK